MIDNFTKIIQYLNNSFEIFDLGDKFFKILDHIASIQGSTKISSQFFTYNV